MKKTLLILAMTIASLAAYADGVWPTDAIISPTGQTTDNSDIAAPLCPTSNVRIDKSNCTITKDGKTYKLRGKYQVVNSFPDIKVQVVSSFPDLKVKKVTSFPDHCGEFQEVSSFPDIKVQFVTSFPDIKVQEVKSFPGF